MKSTIYTISGMTCDHCARAIKASVSTVDGVVGVAVEIVSEGESGLIFKHKDDVELDRSEIEAAIQRAGDYRLL